MTYKLNFISVLLKLLVVALIFSFLFYFTTQKFSFLIFIISFFLIIGLEVIVFFTGTILIKIIIDENAIHLYLKKYLAKNYFVRVPLSELVFSYNREIGAKGVKSKELRFYNKKEKIIGIGKGFDGWETKLIEELISQLQRLNVKELANEK